MKISINSKIFDRPYGGGMQFATFLGKFLRSKGCKVVHTLKDDDIDIILHVTPFPFLMKSSGYSYLDAYAYKLTHPQTVIIQRVNECDERKGTHHMNTRLANVRKYSDAATYTATWVKNLLYHPDIDNHKPSYLVLNGADTDIFHPLQNKQRNPSTKLKLVTHHWSDHYQKGHDIYQKLDVLLGTKSWSDLFEFTYIGNYPKHLVYKHTNLVEPLTGTALADELRKHDVYLTASRNEPGGQHHVEGALCGLPLLYIDSGGIPEYCDGYGIKFTPETFEAAVMRMQREYPMWHERVLDYQNTSTKMGDAYLQVFEELYQYRGRYQATGNLVIRSAHALLLTYYVRIHFVMIVFKKKLQNLLLL
jgi:glycosyltransferase involved in cell wall biosynthesis